MPSLVCLAVFIGLLNLGHWQWQRAEYKQALRDRIVQGQQAQPLTIAEVEELGRDVHSFPVLVEGTLDERHHFLLDNQMRGRYPGFHLLTPLALNDGRVVLVNRGWLPLGKDRSQLPDIPTTIAGTSIPGASENTVSVRGQVYFPSEKQFVLKADDLNAQGWPKLVQSLDLTSIAGVLGVELAPFIIRLDADVMLEQGTQLPREWHFIVMSPEKSRGYSFQWYGMALVLVIMYLVFSTEKRRP